MVEGENYEPNESEKTEASAVCHGDVPMVIPVSSSIRHRRPVYPLFVRSSRGWPGSIPIPVPFGGDCLSCTCSMGAPPGQAGERPGGHHPSRF